MPRVLVALLAGSAVLAGCAERPDPEAADAALPVVRLPPGGAGTVPLPALADDARFGPHPDVRAEALDGGRVLLRARDGFAGLALVPFTAGGEAYALAVDAAPARGLDLVVAGLDPEDPSVLRFSVRRSDGGPVALDEEEGVVALVGDRPYEDNAVDAYDGTALLDLDAAGPGPQRLRLAVREGGRVSRWTEIALLDGRPVGA
jgi:hypothetical protein